MSLMKKFEAYVVMVYPGETIETLDPVQLKEIKRAFHAGVWAVLSTLSPTECEALGLRGDVQEVLQFHADVKAGIA